MLEPFRGIFPTRDIGEQGSVVDFAVLFAIIVYGILATLSGHGTVYLQSLPFSRMADRILAHAPSAGGRSQGEGSVLGGLGRLLDGDN